MRGKKDKGLTMVRGKDCVRLLNKLAFLCDDQIPAIGHINEINCQIITRIFISIFNGRGIHPHLIDISQPEEQQFTRLINFLSFDILHIPLDHIRPDDLIAHNPISLYNLLEILAACELYLPSNGPNNQQQPSNCKDEAVQTTSKAFQTLNLSHSQPPSPSFSDHSETWSSPTNSSLSNNSTFLLTSSSSSSSSSCLSLSSISSHISKSPSPNLIATKQSTNHHHSRNPSRRSSKSIVSSPDSACICYGVRDIGMNTENQTELGEQSNKLSTPRETRTRKIDKSTSTEPEDSKKHHQESHGKQFSSNFDTYEALASHRFALEIGHKLQRALKLEEATKQIEAKLCAITGEINPNVQNKRPNNRSNVKRHTFKPPWKNNPVNKGTTRKVTSVASTMKSNVYTKPLVCSDRIAKLVKSAPHQQSTNRGRLKLNLNSGQCLLDEWKRQNSSLAEAQLQLESTVKSYPSSQRLKRIRERSLIRDARTERARVHRLISDLERKTCSKYLTIQAKEQQLIKSQAEQKIKSFRDNLLTYKDMVKSQMDAEQEKRNRLLNAFTNYYQQQLTLIKEKLDQEENDLTTRYKQSTCDYNKLRRELKSNLEKQIGSLISPR